MKVYYAHPQLLYGTPQEQRDIETLAAAGFTVENPADQISTDMDFYRDLVKQCDGLAFRAFVGGDIPAGVAMEIQAMRVSGGFVIELPSFSGRNILDREQTRLRLMEDGDR